MLSFFRRSRPDTSAGAARDRLQILLAHERGGRTSTAGIGGSIRRGFLG